MDDEKRLEELRAQRDLVHKHLGWLDLQIDELEQVHLGKDTESPPSSKRLPETKTRPLEENENSDSDQSDTESEPDIAIGAYKAPTGDDLIKAKIGCLALFVFGSLLFLFLLFGLPYLID